MASFLSRPMRPELSDVKASASTMMDSPVAANVTAVECAGPEVRSGADGQASRSGAIFDDNFLFGNAVRPVKGRTTR